MTLTIFQTKLAELLSEYNEEAMNHQIEKIDLTPMKAETYGTGSPKIIYYQIEIKTAGK